MWRPRHMCIPHNEKGGIGDSKTIQWWRLGLRWLEASCLFIKHQHSHTLSSWLATEHVVNDRCDVKVDTMEGIWVQRLPGSPEHQQTYRVYSFGRFHPEYPGSMLQRFTTNDQIISNHMNKFFCNIGKQLQSRIPNYGDDYKRYLPQSANKTFFLTPVHSDELIKEIKSLKSQVGLTILGQKS